MSSQFFRLAPTQPPAATNAPTTAGDSEPPSEFEDESRMGGLVSMSMEGRTIPLAQRARSVPISPECRLVGEDADAPHLPLVFRDDGASLRRIHYDVYIPPRSNSVCAQVGCARLGSTTPGGPHYCPNRIVGATTPRAPATKSVSGNKVGMRTPNPGGWTSRRKAC